MPSDNRYWLFHEHCRVGDFLNVIPESQHIFRECEIPLDEPDKTLAEVAPSAQSVLQRLALECELPVNHGNTDDCSSFAVDELIDHIYTTHHTYTRWALWRILALISLEPDMPQGFLTSFEAFAQALCEHLIEEEEGLFPECRNGAFCLLRRNIQRVASEENLFTINHSHGDIANALSDIIDQSHELPDTPAASHICQCLRLLSTDLRVHTYKEEEYLLPALAYARELSNSKRNKHS